MHFPTRLLSLLLLLGPPLRAVLAQSVQPVISEYNDHASGSFEVSNTTLSPMAVVLEPKSFSIDAEGNGSYRALDPGIHLQLSTTSLRLEPRQTATVFYQVKAEGTPTWLCIYASFSAMHAGPGINVKIMLPHTVYVYQHKPLRAEAIRVDSLFYDAERQRVEMQITNDSPSAGRAESVEAKGSHHSATGPGFPLLPGQTRHVSMEWKESKPPTELVIAFDHFTLKRPIAAGAIASEGGAGDAVRRAATETVEAAASVAGIEAK